MPAEELVAAMSTAAGLTDTGAAAAAVQLAGEADWLAKVALDGVSALREAGWTLIVTSGGDPVLAEADCAVSVVSDADPTYEVGSKPGPPVVWRRWRDPQPLHIRG